MTTPRMLPFVTLAAALGITATATDEQAVDAAKAAKDAERSLLEVTGKSTLAEAQAVVKAWKEAAAEGEKAAARVKELEAAAENTARDALITEAMRAGKLAPAQKAWASTQSVAALKAYLEHAPTIPQLKADKVEQPQATTLEWNGKKWGELSFTERHDLYSENHDLYVAMRDAAQAAEA